MASVAPAQGVGPEAAAVSPGNAAATPLARAAIAGLGRGVCLQECDGGFFGGGPTYVVRFADGSIEFTPAFGRAAPHNTPLRFALTELRRGSTSIDVANGVAPVPDLAASRVDYDHGTLVERYDLVENGVEQSFVFARLPAGSGDLVVRGRLECELPATADAGGVRFDLTNVGHFRIGKVVGVAADGARADGTVHLVDGVLELSLPESFVRDAALPLTLDPLIGGVIAVSNSTADLQNPRIAYDLTTDRYLVVWEFPISATDTNIMGQLVNGNGTTFGVGTFIENSSGLAYEPAVANINADDAFVVTYTRNGDVIARAVSASALGFLNGLLVSGEAVVAGGSVQEHYSDLGGEATLVDDTALCVWKSEGLSISPDSIQAREIGIDNGSALNIAINLSSSSVFTVAGNGHENPRISRSGGVAQRYAIVTDFPTSSTNHDPYVTFVNGKGQQIAAPAPLSTSTFDETNPTVDGDGTSFVAAWMRFFAFADDDVLARAFSFDPTTGAIRFNSITATVASSRGDDEGWPSVCWTGGSCLIGYMAQVSPGSNFWSAYVKSVDLMHCTACEGYFWLGRNNGLNLTPQIVCKTAGLFSPEDAMIVWESATTTTFKGDILGQFWSTKDGKVTQFVGSCGKGGTCYAACARLGNSSYAYELRSAAALAPTVFLLSGAQVSFPCGSCLLVPSPLSGVVLGLSTDANGAASVPSAIPNNTNMLNVPLYVQWATVNVATPACARFQVDLSNALSFTIEG